MLGMVLAMIRKYVTQSSHTFLFFASNRKNHYTVSQIISINAIGDVEKAIVAK